MGRKHRLKLALLGWGLILLQACGSVHPFGFLTEAFSQPTDPRRLTPEKLAIIVNQRDPLSVQIGDYYQVRRGIPAQNIIRIGFDPGPKTLPVSTFRDLWETVQSQTPAQVQAYALTWAQPYRVGCMSITAAFTFGFNEAFCAQGCQPTAPSPYFNSDRPNPFDNLQIRPTMALAATSFEAARELIERGLEADGTRPRGTAYLVNTTDGARNVRSQFYGAMLTQFNSVFNLEVINGDQLNGRSDVMFYFTGLAQVSALDTNQYRPGAVADHFTSFGGKLTDSQQMSSLRWLEAGATGSYGTVVEPCNFPQKFPHPGVLMAHYLEGDTLIEAYWKSVFWPGQGIFIGEPLARPFD
ncbi:MAG: TIGR03790 family protein [Leptolyngbyaceae cyanobacterium SM2_3_12]|nr:TIGR03790 family protein [Leptolyngbyaceae cyanobacterium SM2_3_12]